MHMSTVEKGAHYHAMVCTYSNAAIHDNTIPTKGVHKLSINKSIAELLRFLATHLTMHV